MADISRKPWLQVAPVYGAIPFEADESLVTAIERDAVPHLVLLDPPALEGRWVADLRLEMPIEKSWLAGREPIAGFADDEGRQRFGRRLAGRLERPALPTAIQDAVVRPFRRWLDRRGTGLRSALATAGVEFRLLTQWESESTACRLLVIGRRAQVPQTVIDALEEWRNRRATDAQPGDVTLLDCRFCTSDDLSMREYLASVLLDDRFLGPDADVA